MLRSLPYELGKLFHLVVLGLHGNPLTKDILSIYSDLNGTNKLLTHMLDSYSREYKNILISLTQQLRRLLIRDFIDTVASLVNADFHHFINHVRLDYTRKCLDTLGR